MPLTVEQLMQPRIKIINPWPICAKHNNIKDQPNVGDVFDVSADGSISNKSLTIKDVGHYPHLFKPLQWWEDRLIEDMPEYIRLNQKTVCKVHKHFTSYNRKIAFMDSATKYDYLYEITQPATEAEYFHSIK